MENEHRLIKKVLIIIIGVLMFVFGIIIGLLLSGVMGGSPKAVSENKNSEESALLQTICTDEESESLTFPEKQTETVVEDSDEETLESSDSVDELSLQSEEDDNSLTQEENIRIVLDPGHDDVCSRNHPDLGMNEQDINLKIALACRDELNTYAGVEVFMTREDGSCPDNGVGSDDVTGRTAYAESVEADLFVSIHNNATGLGYPSDANGAEVYISVHSAYTDESRKLGEAILARLTTEIDLADRGVLTRIKPEKGYYDDGNVKDWYYLISTSVERGFPGIIIEHAFMDNPHDNAILSDDENLKAMGIADARGIADYFGLEKK